MTVTGAAYVCCIPAYMLFMNPQQHEDAAHGGSRRPERGEGYLSADWAVLLMKDNDKPGFIVRSCSLLTAYDEYLQKGRGGIMKLSGVFFCSRFSSREKASLTATQAASSPLFIPGWQRHRKFVRTHTHLTHLGADLQKAKGGDQRSQRLTKTLLNAVLIFLTWCWQIQTEAQNS